MDAVFGLAEIRVSMHVCTHFYCVGCVDEFLHMDAVGNGLSTLQIAPQMGAVLQVHERYYRDIKFNTASNMYQIGI